MPTNLKKKFAPIDMRGRDVLTIKIVDWSDDDEKAGEPAIDVEVYVNGIFSYELSKVFSITEEQPKKLCLLKAKEFAMLALIKNVN